MGDRSHSLTHFMAAGAEQCLDDYYFLRNTYETINGQEIQLNRILRMLDQDEVSLNWHIDTTPIGRARSRLGYTFDRSGSTLVLPGSIAYQRLRDMNEGDSKRRSSSQLPSRRSYESRQQDRSAMFNSDNGDKSTSASGQRAFAAYEVELSEMEAKRQAKINQREAARKQELAEQEAQQKEYEAKRQAEKERREAARKQAQAEQEAQQKEFEAKRQAEKSQREAARKQAQAEQEAERAEMEAKKQAERNQKATARQQALAEQDAELKESEAKRQSEKTQREAARKQALDDPQAGRTETETKKQTERNQREAARKEALAEQEVEFKEIEVKRQAEKSQREAARKQALAEQEAEQKELEAKRQAEKSQRDAARKQSLAEQEAEADAKKQTEKSRKEAARKQSLVEQEAEADAKKQAEKSQKEAARKQSLAEQEAEADAKKQAEKSQKEAARKQSLVEQEAEADAKKQAKKNPGKSRVTFASTSEDQTSAANETEELEATKQVKQNRVSISEEQTLAANETKELEGQKQAKKNQESNQEDDANISSKGNELDSFTVRYQEPLSSNKKSNTRASLGHLVCEWQPPSNSSTALNYYTIERQLGDQEWLPIEEKINKSQTHIQLDLSSLLSNDKNDNLPSRFRLKAYLNNKKTFTSAPTDEINLTLLNEKDIIVPDVEVLSNNSVQLTWKDDGNRKATMFNIEKKEVREVKWEKVKKVPLSKCAARIDDLTDAHQCQFRLAPSSDESLMKSEDENEPELLTVQNVNEWLNSLHLEPTTSKKVDIRVSKEGFKDFDGYKVEYTTIDQLDQWEQVADITSDAPNLTVDELEPGADYKFRLTPILHGSTEANDATSSHLSLVLDVKMPTIRKGRLIINEAKPSAPPTQFAVHHTDPKTALIEAIVPADKPATFEDVFDVYSKKETTDDDWVKVGTIDRDHLSITTKDLEENTGYTFKINNQASPTSEEPSNIIQEFKFETASVKLYDPTIFLEKVEQSLENVVTGVMRAAAGHQAVEDPVNISLNEVIKEIFHDESLVPNEQYGFDTLALSDDLQLFRGPKQLLLQDLEDNRTGDLSQQDGEIIIHNYRHIGREPQPVIVREENGNTRIGNVDGDVIIRNVVTDIVLMNEETRGQLSMNIVGQAFLKRIQGVLIASKFKGIIVVKNVNKP